jgi:hypothetical protein
LDDQVKVVSFTQSELNSFKAKRDILHNNIKTQHGKVQQLKDNLKDVIGGQGTMKEEIKKVEWVQSYMYQK